MYKLLILLCFIPVEALSSEQECLAKNIYFEARGESTAGQIAVGQVTINRVKSDRFPNTVCAVVHEAVVKEGIPVKNRCQFSWYCDGIPEAITDRELYERIHKLAKYLMVSDIPDITDGALFFHNHTVNPKWKLRKVTIIGNHIFYR